jgi:hypothetical protein
MAITKSAPSQIGSTTGLATGGASFTSTALDVSSAIGVEIELVYTYGTAPTTGTLDVEVYDSQDGTNYADFPVYSDSCSPTASGRATFQFDAVALKNIAVKVANNTDQAPDVVINAITVSI